MKEELNDINDLLGKFLSDEATALERKQVEKWIDESDANQSYFNHLKLIFDRAAAIKDTKDFDVDKAWLNVKSKLSDQKKGKTITISPRQVFFRVAAILVIAVGLGFFIYPLFNQSGEIKSFASNKRIIKDSLPDGTLAVLNKETKIQYSSNWEERKVILEGEAFFDVKHDEDKQFIVEANGLIIEDIGTAFNVKADKGSSLVEVYVESGEVSIHSLTSERYNLLAGEAGVFDLESQLFSKIEKPDTNKLAYKTGVFNFRNVTLETILQDLNGVYPVKIKVRNEAMNHCRLTVTFKNETIDNIVEIIAESLNLTVSKEGEDFVLDGAGCEN